MILQRLFKILRAYRVRPPTFNRLQDRSSVVFMGTQDQNRKSWARTIVPQPARLNQTLSASSGRSLSSAGGDHVYMYTVCHYTTLARTSENTDQDVAYTHVPGSPKATKGKGGRQTRGSMVLPLALPEL